MTNDEAEKLARYVQAIIWKAFSRDTFHDEVDKLCDHILSGSMKREIENAAYERAMMECDLFAKEQRVHHGPYAYASNAALQCRHRIRSLIQPPAQKENGE